jgi:hypothetical protein
VSGRRWALGLAGVVALTLLGALAFLGVYPTGLRGPYANATPALAVAYRAKDGCTCLYVLRRSPEQCRAWTVASPDVASFEPDAANGTVSSRSLFFWSARARYTGARDGCRLE